MKNRLELDKQPALVLCTILMCLSWLTMAVAILFFVQSVIGIVTAVIVCEFGALLEYLVRLVLIPFPLFICHVLLSMLGKVMRRKVDNTIGSKVVFDKNEILSVIRRMKKRK